MATALERRGEYKTCADCKRTMHESNFLKKNDRPRQRNRRSSYCHPCRARRLRDYNLRTKYDISLADYNGLLRAQNGLCAICRGGPNSSRTNLCVDHDHETGKVRGLLCVRCKALIGQALEDPRILYRAIDYLQETPDA